MGQKHLHTAALSERIEIDVGGREPPKEIQLFAAGVNQTEKGDFVFDAKAAELVMAAFARKGLDAIPIDYDHGMAVENGDKSAAGWFKPEVRDGALWATDIRWTPRATAKLTDAEYRFFSPWFSFEEESRRVTRLLNFALTNTPAMDGIDALVAASANPKEPEMSCESCEKLSEEIKGLKAKLSAFEKDDKEKTEKMTALSASLRSVVGVSTDGELVGAVTALKDARDRLAASEAKSAALIAEKLKGEFTALLTKAVHTDFKVAPAQESYWREKAEKHGTEEAIRDLTAFLASAIPLVPTKETKQPESTVALSETRLAIARQFGRDINKVQEFESKRLAGQV